MEKIILYTTEFCPYCNTIKEFLKENGKDFESFDVGKNMQAQKEMVGKTGQLGVPVLDIYGKIITGFDKERMCYLLGLKH